jgi:hydroxymethylpyrimidine/phosphomethylpyrimidine kinase
MDRLPSVLCIGGHDPTGGAGIQADIETLATHRVRAFTLVTCLTAQDTANVREIWPTPAAQFRRQRDTLLDDLTPDVVKIGLLGSAEVAAAVLEWIAAVDLPIVLDPVLAAGGGARLSDRRLLQTLRSGLLPKTRLAVPNRAELSALSAARAEPDAAAELLSLGTQAVLVTGADAASAQGSDQVTNTLYTRADPTRSWNWPLLPGVYHGSGCTLASACAAGLAQGKPLHEAVRSAQDFTWQALQRAEDLGRAQHLPTRLP